MITFLVPFIVAIIVPFSKSSTETWWSSSIPAQAAFSPSFENAIANTPFLTGLWKVLSNCPSLNKHTKGFGPS